eukprot:329247-Pelagomonas_calceolata.AAC.1
MNRATLAHPTHLQSDAPQGQAKPRSPSERPQASTCSSIATLPLSAASTSITLHLHTPMSLCSPPELFMLTELMTDRRECAVPGAPRFSACLGPRCVISCGVLPSRTTLEEQAVVEGAEECV